MKISETETPPWRTPVKSGQARNITPGISPPERHHPVRAATVEDVFKCLPWGVRGRAPHVVVKRAWAARLRSAGRAPRRPAGPAPQRDALAVAGPTACACACAVDDGLADGGRDRASETTRMWCVAKSRVAMRDAPRDAVPSR